jgi:DNA-directed RNA polymerase subunit N (RpoN/RPB10)
MIVDVECDYCKKILQTSYKKYLNNVQKGGKYACSKICGSLKAKETCKEKYGVFS